MVAFQFGQRPPQPSSNGSSSSSSSSSNAGVVDFSSSPFRSQLYAQEMNNSAASCIEVGLYGRAIASLLRALALSRRQRVPREATCTCRHCILDACIVRSRVVGRRTVRVATRTSATTGASATSTSTTEFDDESEDDTTDDDDDNDDDDNNDNNNNTNGNNNNTNGNNNNTNDNGTDYDPNDYDDEQSFSSGSYIIQNPIRVECRGHVMGPALYLIITFNLALTNHLMGLCANNTATERATRAGKALELYKLTYRMQANILHRETEDTRDKDPSLPSWSPAFAAAVRSIRFEMMILNNTSQVHKKLTRDPTMHRWCLRRLLSTMMIVVDHQMRVATAEGAVPIDPMWQIDMDGFFKNTIYLILGDAYTSGVA